MTKTERLITQLNSVRGLTYPNKGYMMYQDIRGDGRNRKSCYTIINGDGGVIANCLNGLSAKARCDSLRVCIRLEGATPAC